MKKHCFFFEKNPYHPSLKLHKLEGRLSSLYSVSINILYRITIDFIFKKDDIIIINVGTNDEIY